MRINFPALWTLQGCQLYLEEQRVRAINFLRELCIKSIKYSLYKLFQESEKSTFSKKCYILFWSATLWYFVTTEAVKLYSTQHSPSNSAVIEGEILLIIFSETVLAIWKAKHQMFPLWDLFLRTPSPSRSSAHPGQEHQIASPVCKDIK